MSIMPSWNAERVQHIAPTGRVSAEVVCELERFGDAWLPRRAEYYRGGRLVETVQIKTAEFSAQKGPKRFTASDIGMETVPSSRLMSSLTSSSSRREAVARRTPPAPRLLGDPAGSGGCTAPSSPETCGPGLAAVS